MTYVLDHLYFSVPLKVCKELAKVAELHGDLVFNEVYSKKSSWRGLYLKTKCGDYLEIVNADTQKRFGNFGIALSNHGKEIGLLRKLKALHPNNVWKAADVNKPKSRWFTAIYDESLESKNLALWWMHYRNYQRIRRQNFKNIPHNISKMVNVKLGGPKSKIKDFEKGLAFLSSKKNKSTSYTLVGAKGEIGVQLVEDSKSWIEVTFEVDRKMTITYSGKNITVIAKAGRLRLLVRI